MLFSVGYLGLFLASFLAATVIPFSSEAILSAMIYGNYNVAICLSVATLGNSLGGLTGYGLGYFGKVVWIEKYLRIPYEKTEKLKLKIDGKEAWISFFCWLPFVGDIISVVLGLLKVNFGKVALGMFLGKAARYIVWAYFTIWALS